MPWISRFLSLSLVILLVGLIPEIAGIDPVQAILRARAGADQLLTAEALQAVRNDLQLADNAFERLYYWLLNIFKGDFGLSWVSHDPVIDLVQQSAKVSLLLMLSALGLTLFFCTISLIYTALNWRKNQANINHNSLTSLLVSLPEYVIALLLILFFSIWLQWLPPYGWQGVRYLFLPSLALAIPAAGFFSRLLIDSLKQVLNEPWVITWLSANISQFQIFRFALYRAISNLIPQIALMIIGLTGGAVAVEQIFAIPGLGRTILNAAKSQDLPTLQGGLLFLLLFSMLISSLSIVLQRYVLGHSVKNAKLISNHNNFKFTKNKIKRFLSFSLLFALFLCVLLAAFRDPFSVQFSRLAAPSFAAPFGADALGRDLLARVGAGMLTTLKMGLLATFLSLLLGLILGFISRFTQGLIEVTKALPYIVMGLLIAGIMGMSAKSAMIAIVLVSWAPIAAHCSSLLVEVKAQPYTHLAPVWGTSKWRVFRFYLLPYVLPPLLKHALLRFPVITLSLTSLSFIGLGAKPPEPEWGLLIAENLAYIERAPQAVLLPIAGLVMVSIAINLLFDE